MGVGDSLELVSQHPGTIRDSDRNSALVVGGCLHGSMRSGTRLRVSISMHQSCRDNAGSSEHSCVAVWKAIEAEKGGLRWWQVMLDELSEAYSALRVGKAPVLPLVRLQYPDFAAWQSRRSQSPAILRQVWCRALNFQCFPRAQCMTCR